MAVPSVAGVLTKDKLRKIFLLLVLGTGSLMGVPMEPQRIDELMEAMNQTRVEVTIHKEDVQGGTE